MKTCHPLIMIALVASLSGCGGNEETDTTTATPAVTEAPAAATDSGAVAFEPAYPEDVSTETLSTEDAAQQKVHAHDGEDAHAHDQETEADHGHPH